MSKHLPQQGGNFCLGSHKQAEVNSNTQGNRNKYIGHTSCKARCVLVKRWTSRLFGILRLVWMAPRVSTLPIQPQIPEISVGTSNRTDHLGLIRPEYLGAALKVVHFDRSDRNVSFHSTKLLSRVPLFRILLTRTITKRAVAWVESEQPECTVPLNTWNFRNFKTEFLLNGNHPMFTLILSAEAPARYHNKKEALITIR